MKTFKYALLLAGFLNTTACLAQSSVLVEYDFIANQVLSVQYLTENNDTVKSSSNIIKVKSETPVHIHIKNFNNEALVAQSSIQKNNFVVPEGSSSFDGFFDAFSMLISPALGMDLDKLLGTKRGIERQELQEMLPDFSVLEPDGNSISALKVNSLINELFLKIANWRTASNTLNSLRYTTELTKNETIKGADKVLISISKDAPSSFTKGEIRNTMTSIAQENYDFLNLGLKAYNKAVGEINTDGMNEGQLFKVELIKKNLIKYEKLVNSDLETEINQVLLGLIDSYEAINNNTFETTLDLVIDENANLLSLEVFPKTKGDSEVNKSTIKSQSITIKSPGNIIFSNTIGVSFIGFTSPQKSYFLNDRSQIVDVKGDFILRRPTLFMNFLKVSNKRVKLGGNFGIGVPLAEKKAIHFQLEPSLFLGKDSPIAINLGIVAGKVNRLSGGLKVGDTFKQSPNIPTIERYELGYQFGISFNMARGLNQAFNAKDTASN